MKAFVLVVFWAVGLVVFNSSPIIHILLIISLMAIILGLITGKDTKV
jgi:hypothetical protein